MLPMDVEQIASVVQEETESPPAAPTSPSDIYDDGRFDNREDDI